MPMPRVVSGTAPSAAVFNTLAQEVDDLGAGCKVVRTTATTVPAADSVITWQSAEYDLATPMWSSAIPQMVTCRSSGVYQVTLQIRFGPGDGDGEARAGKIMLNGTSVFTNSQASDKRVSSSTGEGITLSMTAVIRLGLNDKLYANVWQNSGVTITGHQADYGGSFMTVNRIGPLVG